MKEKTLEMMAQEVQKEYAHKIVLAEVDGKLQELTKNAKEGSDIRFITMGETVGIDVYRRSMSFLLLKAIHDLFGVDKASVCKIETSVGKGVYCHFLDGQIVDTALLECIENQMRALVEENLPIVRECISTDAAVAIFEKEKMKDKVELFHYRRPSTTNVYRIENYVNYFYGYLVPSTGYLDKFQLYLYGDGFVIQMPTKTQPEEVPPFAPAEKLFQVLQERQNWQHHMGIHNVGELNKAIVQGKMNQVVLTQEALMEKRIADIAEQISMGGQTKLILIAGPSSSGKTTFSHRLSIQLMAHGMKPHPIEVDNYFVNRENSPRDENGNYNFEEIECIDRELLRKDVSELLEGKRVALPTYNFFTGCREYKGNFLQLGDNDVMVLEGIHCLNPALLGEAGEKQVFKIYISALTQMNVDMHNRISTTDGRLIRRIVRDARTRGHSAKDTICMWESVRKGEEKNIFPYQEEADAIFNSSLLYEFAVLKQYAEPLLFQIRRGEAEYAEAKRLLKFFEYFLGMNSEDIPNNSIVREFIGGSCFKV